jgi:beta-glucanase (GH16 family)
MADPVMKKLQIVCAICYFCLLTSCGGGSESVANTDSALPSVIISDDVIGTTATAPFTITFDFNKDVGNSFDASDIIVSGAATTTFTRNSGTQAKLFVTLPSNMIGTINASISIGTFQDLSNRSNQEAANFTRAFTSAIINPSNSWTLDWSDEFNGASLDTTIWNYDLGASGWGNNESQYYQPQNVRVGGGLLTITAKKELVGGAQYTSARIQTSRKKTFSYGRFEMRAKLPATQGMWPAFWLLGESCNSFGLYGGNLNWPNCGEIDIMEMVGGLADGSGDFTTHGTLHYLNAAGFNPAPSYSYRSPTKLSAGFHVYTLDWTPQSFTWYIDGVAFGSKAFAADMNAFQKPFFILLNLAVGGNWGGWPDASTVFPQTYEIDYVRHYSKSYPVARTTTGLPSAFHLTNDPHLNVAAGTTSGFQPIITLSTTALSWYTPYLTGNYDAGVWSASVWTPSPSAVTSVRARIFRQSAAGVETLMGESTMDTSTTGAGNHITRFTFSGIPAVTLSTDTIRLKLTKLSGPNLQMIVNGNDFDSRLDMPFSASGTYASYPTATSTPFPVF